MTHAEAGAGTCFGFEVHSALRFHYLRGGSGQPLRIGIAPSDEGPPGDLYMQWTPSDDAPLDARLYRADGRFRFWTRDDGWWDIRPEAVEIGVPDAPDLVRREERLWGIPMTLCLLHRGDLPLHAAAVEVGDGAVLLAAPRKFGKTTLAAAFSALGHRLLSEDLACVRLGDRPHVVPGPAMLRVRHDVAERLEMRSAQPIGTSDDRVHFAIDPDARGDCTPVPLRGIFLLHPSKSEIRVERVTPAEGVRDMWSLSSGLPTREGLARCFADLVDVARTVPIWRLHRPLRIDRLPATVSVVASTVSG